MKKFFSFTLEGRDWWKPFLGYWAIYLVFYIPVLASNPGVGEADPAAAGASLLSSLAMLLFSMLIAPVFSIIFLRIMMPKLSIDGKSFGFRGEIGRFIGMNVGGILLSIITLSIYMPWYIRRVTAYIAGETTFDGESPEFQGKGGKLFVYYLLCILLPVFLIIIIMIGAVTAAVVAATLGGESTYAAAQTSAAIWTSLFSLVIIAAAIPFSYLMCKWYVDLKWKDVTIALKADFWPSCGYILAQALLTAVTIGIYWPAATLKLFGYFAERTALSRENREIGRLGFDGRIGQGFLLIWGQTLLCIITLGIYIPWAYARIGKWMASTTYYRESAPGV